MLRIVFIILLLLSISSCGAEEKQSPTVIRAGILPDMTSPKLIEKYNPLIDYLSLEINRPIKLVIPDSYNHLLELFVAKEIDIAFMGGLTFIQAQQQVGAIPLAMRDIDIRFTSQFITRQDDPGIHISDFKDRTFGFGSQLSTSGHLMPRFYLNSVNILPESFFKSVKYTGTHDKSIYMVLKGELDLAVVNAQVLESLIKSGDVNKDKIKVIWNTPPYTDYIWATQPDMNEEMREKLLIAFMELSQTNPIHKNIMTRMGSINFLPGKSSDFNKLREIATELGML